MSDLSEEDTKAVEFAGDFLDVVESTPMTKSFKMLNLIAMLNRDAFPGQIDISTLASEFRRIARRSKTLRGDVGESLENDARLRSLIESNPIAAWCGGKGTGGRTYFQYDGSISSTDIAVPADCREGFQNLVRELVDWCLAEYLDRGEVESTSDRFVCRVLHSSGRPIVKLPDRKKTPGVPLGWVNIVANGRTYVANFVKEFLNVVRADQNSTDNLLPVIVRGWFGLDAGKPGTRYEVAFEKVDDILRMDPATRKESAGTADPWRHYMRADIPSLFGLTFNPGNWNQGFIVANCHVFLLVTLEKGGLNKDHRYEDHFLSADRFQWQSQNKTKQDSRHGKLIRDHQQMGVAVHLFVRKHKILDGKAAPFIYCGEVDFESWEGEKPISVIWRLREPVPMAIAGAIDVPSEAE